MTYLQLFVAGKPAPQGSKRYLGVKGGRGITVESSKAAAPWRADVRDAVADHIGAFFATFQPAEPVDVELCFVMPRPVSTPKRSTPAAVKRPDVDKLARAVLDALSSAGVWCDDSQVVRLVASKRIAQIGEKPGCHIWVGDSADRRWTAEDSSTARTLDAAQGDDL
jgi:crossover junction endodeoxyribonuclease RusA